MSFENIKDIQPGRCAAIRDRVTSLDEKPSTVAVGAEARITPVFHFGLTDALHGIATRSSDSSVWEPSWSCVTWSPSPAALATPSSISARSTSRSTRCSTLSAPKTTPCLLANVHGRRKPRNSRHQRPSVPVKTSRSPVVTTRPSLSARQLANRIQPSARCAAPPR